MRVIIFLVFLYFISVGGCGHHGKIYNYDDDIDYSWTEKQGYFIDYEIVNSMEDPVLFNRESRIYHEIDCEWARKCTKNCVYLERDEAISLGRHCRVCNE